MELIDSHAHLEFAQFDADREAMLDRARAAGVVGITAIGSGSGPGQLEAALPFAQSHDWIWATIGIHPHEAAEATEEHFARLAGLAAGAMLAGRDSRKRVLGVPMPRKSTTKNIANASKNVASFGEGMGSLASEVHRITTGLSDANAGRRSPIEVVLSGLTNRHG